MKYFILVLATFAFVSCGDGKRSNYTTLNEEGEAVMSETSQKIMDDLVEDCEACKATSKKNLLDCKHFTAKAICEFYEIDEFKKGHDFIEYNEMHDIILGKFGTWVLLGDASDQEVLKVAQTKANNGQATVAVSTKSAYGHVVIIVPGHLEEGKSWGLDLPNCASFFMVKNLKSFSSKPLNYAWRSPNDIKIYTRSAA